MGVAPAARRPSRAARSAARSLVARPGRRVTPHARPPGRARALLAARRDESGLMTLEWLLIVAAVAGLAAGSVLAIQNVLDENIDVPWRPEVQLIDADVAAAQIVAEAQQAELAAAADPAVTYDDNEFETRCVINLQRQFAAVVVSATWTPRGIPDPDPDIPTPPPKCDVKAQAP